MRILLAGGAGYIGTHIIVSLCAQGHVPIVVDDLSNSSKVAIERVERIVERPISFHQADLRDTDTLRRLFDQEGPDAVIHLAGLKAVGESVAQPLRYYDTNINATVSLLRVMAEKQVHKLIFSSSATVYGDPESLPLTEDSRVGGGISNPYGWTKFMIEQILRDIAPTDPRWQITLLRYFNPVGAHPSGLIGEDPAGIPNNLMPFIAQVAAGRRDHVNVFGDDYDTADGTGVRDYIHVMDLAEGHVAALNHLTNGVATYNLGTGQGTSVLQLIHAFSAACGAPIPYQITARRPGDVAACYCSPAKATRDLGWQATRTIDDACRDSWNWQSQNPAGYPAA
ncbi:MAG: UDP-glucose 4-epimerase GalE [Propionibacteriaceae bacterium]|jgi:UDP-glucose 4-epimerase|nr:UDP-glucose 4-epimerase GalE [Propionibacteriaceae bacterium]